jgi:PAS domain S-box-containing protein
MAWNSMIDISHPSASASEIMPTDTPAVEEIPCTSEEIRLPGSIQPHGFLLVLDGDAETIEMASENAVGFLRAPLKLLLGARIEVALEREMIAALRHNIGQDTAPGVVQYLGAYHLRGDLFSLSWHSVGEHNVLEFERQDRLVGPELMNSVITNFVSTLNRIGTEQRLCEVLAEQIAGLTGFDRVLVYSFDEAGHGTVLAEQNNGILPSYLGLRFPASDIPPQARALYVQNTVRIIPSATYTPSPIIAADGPVRDLDLSLSVLRSVSPTHLEYMRNMGTDSSMSVSILRDGKLWGLISAHNGSSKLVPYLVRSACDMLSRIAGTQLAAYQTASRYAQIVHFHSVHRRLLTSVAINDDLGAALSQQMAELMSVAKSDGVAMLIDGQYHSGGSVPPQEFVYNLVEWLDRTIVDEEVFSTVHLGELYPAAEPFVATASGVLAVRVGTRRSYIIWFRSQMIGTVRWAGEPVKQVDPTGVLHPRNSFEVWREQLGGQSARWEEMEIESVRDFRTALLTISLRRAEEEVEASEARFYKLTETIPVMVWATDAAGHLTFSNRHREQYLGGNGDWFEDQAVHADDIPGFRELWAKALRTAVAFDAEIRMRRKQDGAYRWHLLRAVPYQGGLGRGGWVGTCTDIQDRHVQEQENLTTEKLALTGRMNSVLAHEINNPLEAITNLMFLISREVPAEGNAQDYIALVESEIQRISGITKQTLRWSRVSDHDSIDAASLFDDVLRLFTGKIRNKAVQVRVDVVDEIRFPGSLGKIRQVIANLVSNAIDAVEVETGLLILTARRQDGEVELSVLDNGRGMSQEIRERIFQPFYSTKGDLGNGLGLYLSREILDKHAGRIAVQSEPGEGTAMRVYLPM